MIDINFFGVANFFTMFYKQGETSTKINVQFNGRTTWKNGEIIGCVSKVIYAHVTSVVHVTNVDNENYHPCV